MKFIRRYSYPKLDRVTKDDGVRFYKDIFGNNVYSVTTILSATEHKPQLEEWKKRVGEKKANLIKEEAANLGTLLHTNLENYIMGIERPRGNHVLRKLSREMADIIIEKGFQNIDEIWGIEENLCYPCFYAGTADLIGIHNGVPAIMDYKTTKRIKQKDMISDYFCQGVAYCLAHNELFDTDIKKIVIFMVSREYDYKEFIIEGNEFDYWADEWLRRLEIFMNK